RTCACARFAGEFGAAPVERGYWFKGESVEGARGRIDALCGSPYRERQEAWASGKRGAGAGAGAASREESIQQRRLVVYQRDKDRRILNMEGIVEGLRSRLGPQWDVSVIIHDNMYEPCWLYSELMDTDLLLTPHGFQSMLLLFLPIGATILEVFPYKYWKAGYAPLATEWWVRYEYIMSHPVTWSKGLTLFFIPLVR
ncbi:unnamed protein product, partial [Choristocarpus tenellus]